ncbi:MAG: sugar transferase [Capsulimonadaceae bacterium]|nr:sugar transferase [Capsulimonadaceae bacterium]
MNLRILSPGRIGQEIGIVTRQRTASSRHAFGSDLFVPAVYAAPGFHVVRRVCDVLGASAALLAMLLPCMMIALLIKLESPGPVLFRQKRVGQDGEEFWFYKFRSMVVDAEARRKALIRMNEASGPVFKIRNDPRITRVGRFIRKFSLDEVPQLVNVLKGDMSLVGPRPALPSEVEQYSDRQRARLLVKPGITGLWQVSGRSDLPFERSIELDLEYIANQTFPLYVRILLMTLPAVLEGRGAY